jgi:hypothetical protein
MAAAGLRGALMHRDLDPCATLLLREGGQFHAVCVPADIEASGRTPEQACEALCEAIERARLRSMSTHGSARAGLPAAPGWTHASWHAARHERRYAGQNGVALLLRDLLTRRDG